LTVTNPLRIKTAIEKKACNGLLLKVGGNDDLDCDVS
jgi:enolase